MNNQYLLNIVKVAKEEKIDESLLREFLKLNISLVVQQNMFEFLRGYIPKNNALFKDFINMASNLNEERIENLFWNWQQFELLNNVYKKDKDIDKIKVTLEQLGRLNEIFAPSNVNTMVLNAHSKSNVKETKFYYFRTMTFFYRYRNNNLINETYFCAKYFNDESIDYEVREKMVDLLKPFLFNSELSYIFGEMCLKYGWTYTYFIVEIYNMTNILIKENINTYGEEYIRKEIYRYLVKLDSDIVYNFLKSNAYLKRVLFDEQISLNIRKNYLEIIETVFGDGRYILSDKVMKLIIDDYNNYGYKHAIKIAHLLRNTGIRHSKDSINLITNEPDDGLILFLKPLLKINRVRRNKEIFEKYASLDTVAQKEDYLNDLYDKYISDSEGHITFPINEAQKSLQVAFEQYLLGEANLDELEQALDENKDYNLSLTRTI
ncbi:MAG: hypothetical protein E7163_00530 [Firmicutes bacterium]|nr:hypothetical protein [Bacillota bacterium]